jgi:hypothetical protein
MSFSVTIPVANAAAASATLQAAGWGSNNFNIPVWTAGPQPAIAALHHIGNDPAFQAACAALPGAVVRTYAGLTVGMDATATAVAGRWGSNAPALAGQVTPGLYRDGATLWWVIQSFDRSVFNLAPETYPALLRRARVPGEVAPWVQPLDQFDAYRPVNAFTGRPDQVTHLGQTWRCAQGDGAGNNVFEPGVFGWVAI